MPIDPEFEFKKALESTEKMFGFTLFGYWVFFSEYDAAQVIEEHVNLIS